MEEARYNCSVCARRPQRRRKKSAHFLTARTSERASERAPPPVGSAPRPSPIAAGSLPQTSGVRPDREKPRPVAPATAEEVSTVAAAGGHCSGGIVGVAQRRHRRRRQPFHFRQRSMGSLSAGPIDCCNGHQTSVHHPPFSKYRRNGALEHLAIGQFLHQSPKIKGSRRKEKTGF